MRPNNPPCCCRRYASADADFAQSGDEAIDATDPTKVYTYFGGGLKYNEYTNSDYMVELRLTGNLGLQTNVVGAWDKEWNNFNGAGPGVNAQFIYSPEHWWPGAQIQIIPQYTTFLTGKLDGEGSGALELNIGGEITPTVMWDITYSKNLGLDLKSLSRDIFNAELENDWNVFFNVTSYF